MQDQKPEADRQMRWSIDSRQSAVNRSIGCVIDNLQQKAGNQLSPDLFLQRTQFIAFLINEIK